MAPFTVLTAVAAPLDIAKIDTGMIVPGRFQRLPRRAGHADYARVFLHDLRFDAQEQPRAEFILNQSAYQQAGILVTGPDFGCGSSRESAAYATLDFGKSEGTPLREQLIAAAFERACMADPLPVTRAQFDLRCGEAKSRLNLIANELCRLVGNILTEYQGLQKKLQG